MIDGTVALDRDAMHHPGRRRIIGDGEMLGAAVVPHHQIIRAPAMAHLEADLLDMLEQHAQEPRTLQLRNALDLRGEGAIDEQRLAPRFRMCPHHRMRDRRKLGLDSWRSRRPSGRARTISR